MGDDLVKRLRDWSEYDEGKINDDREEAADRIKKLETALKQYACGCHKQDKCGMDGSEDCGWTAQRALEHGND